jgi:hypothetical protein
MIRKKLEKFECNQCDILLSMKFCIAEAIHSHS